MTFFAVLFALLLEQLKPLPRDNGVHEAVQAWVDWTGRNLDAGLPRHAWVVWGVAVLVPTLGIAAVYAALAYFNLFAALAFDVLVLYLTLGFRQFSHYFTDIREALESGDDARARSLLAEWRHLDASELPRTELLRHVIEHALLAAHRHVFGVFFWFVLGSALGLGPAGAVLYRLAEFVNRYWAFRFRSTPGTVSLQLRDRVRQLFNLIDHFPARLTAFGFAVVGNFEEAVNGWRRDARLWKHANEGIILAAAAGAVGVQLGGGAPTGVTPDRSSSTTADAAEADELAAEGSTPGAPAQGGHLQTMVGLVWRSVILWMLLVALLSLANVLG